MPATLATPPPAARLKDAAEEPIEENPATPAVETPDAPPAADPDAPEETEKTLSREEFEAMDHSARNEFFRTGGRVL